jgi:hypothetical protein
LHPDQFGHRLVTPSGVVKRRFVQDERFAIVVRPVVRAVRARGDERGGGRFRLLDRPWVLAARRPLEYASINGGRSDRDRDRRVAVIVERMVRAVLLGIVEQTLL